MQSKLTPYDELKANWRNLGAELVAQLLRPRNLVIGAMLVILLLLTACSRAPIVTGRNVLLEPPTKFLLPTPFPEDYVGNTNEDLLLYFDEWEAALKSCNSDKESMTLWVQGSKELISPRE